MSRTIAATFLTLLVLVPPITASDVAVVVDVSGSMASYGNWQPDALSLVEAILSGNSTSGLNYDHTDPIDAISDFKLGSGDSIQLLKFGSAQRNAFPFFETKRLEALSELRSQFPMSKGEFRDPHTNKDLAIAVGSRLAGNAPDHLVMISDFLIDSSVDPAQQRFVTEFQASSKIETPVIFTWKQDRRVQVKLIATSVKETNGNGAAPPPQAPTASVHILESRVSADSNRIYFRWQVQPSVPVHSFRLLLRDAKTGRVAKEQGPLAAVYSTMIEAPHSGEYSAIVTADFDDGSQIQSRPVVVTIKGRNGGAVAVVLILAAVGAGVWYASVRGQRRATERRGPVTEEEDD